MNTKSKGMILAMGLLTVTGLLSGCATSRIEENAEPLKTTLVVTRTGEQVMLNWQSVTGRVYSVFYTDKLSGNGRWQPLADCQNLQGTGQSLTCGDTAPQGESRYYRIQAVSVTGK